MPNDQCKAAHEKNEISPDGNYHLAKNNDKNFAVVIKSSYLSEFITKKSAKYVTKTVHTNLNFKVGTVLAIHNTSKSNNSLSNPSTTGETEMIKFALKTLVAATLAAGSFSTFAEEAKSPVTGSVGVYSKYIFRGGVEDDTTALQAGVNYATKSGITVGYWGSTLSYDPTKSGSFGVDENGIESNFFANYPIAVSEDLTVTPQVLVYYYHNGTDNAGGRDTTAYEPSVSFAYKGVTTGVAVMANDHGFGNAGDVYLSAAYSHALPNDFTLNLSAGAYAYADGGDDASFTTTQDFEFNEARVGLSHPVGTTGATVAVSYLIGGTGRTGVDFDDQVLLGLSYGF